MKKHNATIVKKIKRGGGEGHHGGAWKVAYADFVTAMMAFFLLMWLLNMTSEEKRARLTLYFKNFSIYDQGGTSFMDKSSSMFSESGQSSQKALQEMVAEHLDNIKEMEEKLKRGIMSKLEGAQDQVVVDTVEGGVRIQMMDKDGSLMFESGSNRLTPKAKEILLVIGQNINKLPNKVSIEGHTDATPYAGSDYSNWELSTERASSARKELESNGLDPKRIDRVSGYADKDPLILDNPKDPRNRRISIILKVPYFDENKSPENKTVQNDRENLVEKPDEGSLVVNKFDENLSLIKTGMSEAEKSKAASSAAENKQSAPVTTKDTANLENKNWGAVLKKDEWSPVIKDELKPVIANSNSTGTNAVPKQNESSLQKKEDKPILKNLQIPVISKDTSKAVAKTGAKEANDSLFTTSKTKKSESNSTLNKNEASPVISQDNNVSEKKPSIIKELSTPPVISKDDLFR